MKEISSISSYDQYLFHEGRHFRSYEIMGAHPGVMEGRKGVRFTVWAPKAKEVRIIGEFNEWQGDDHVMSRLTDAGIWELFIEDIGPGEMYKFEIVASNGSVKHKADPYAFWAEVRPGSASSVFGLGNYQWQDSAWQNDERPTGKLDQPMLIYEVHLGSWRLKEGGELFTYRDLAKELVEYLVEMNYTHVEIMPVAEHPFDGSWGYQAIGFYAPTSRYGNPDDFKYFVDCNFDFCRPEVWSYLIGNAIYWFEVFHIDAIRVDAVANLLYRDYGKEEGQWMANKYGGKEDLEAVEFIKKLNEVIHHDYPRALVFAEESTTWAYLTMPVYLGGLGFDYKWNMGWMNDTLKYASLEPIHRKWNHQLLTFSLLYAFSENFLLPLSHDEVVHGKRSLLDKMPGDYWQKFANLRAFYGYFMGHPGKKLLFMGGEFGQFIEWNEADSLDWHLLEYEMHNKLHQYVKVLNHYYREDEAFWSLDTNWKGFEWIDCNDCDQSIVSFLRKASDGEMTVVLSNFTPVVRHNYRLGVPKAGEYQEVFNSDATEFGGSGIVNGSLVAEQIAWHTQPCSLVLTVPPLATIYLKLDQELLSEVGEECAPKRVSGYDSGRRSGK
ncbi:MAG: glycogen branching protein [Firmicutes bacterium]|nr:glycogen branching protein [Bacillota bacterium]